MFLRQCLSLGLCSALALGLGCDAAKKRRKAKDDAATPGSSSPLRLVLMVVVDQLPSWTFERDRELLTGGFKRAMESAIFVPRAHYPYATTFTAPGHAALATGAPPSESGILANSWYRRKTKKKRSAVQDDAAPIFMLSGEQPSGGISSRQLRVKGLADMLAQQTGGRGRSVSISLKDRSAVLGLGQRPNYAIWYDDDQRAMTTSSFYSDLPPSWLLAFRGEEPIERYLSQEWTASDPTVLEQTTGVPDNQEGEGVAFGWDRSLPHSLASATKPEEALRLTPAGTDLLFATGRAATLGENLGVDDTVDLLMISVSSHDYAGHYWGQESWERLDLLIKLDKTLGAFMEFLDDRVGVGRYAVVIASDHGAAPLVELSIASGKDAHRVNTKRLLKSANEAAEKALGKGPWVAAYSASSIFMNEAFHALAPTKKSAAMAAMLESLRQIPGIALAVDTAKFKNGCAAQSGMNEMACLSVNEESGEIFVTPKENSTLSGGYKTGTSHGSPAAHDRFVPLIISAPGIQAQTITKPISMLQLAPTLTGLMGIARPPAALAPSIFDM